MMTCHAMPRCDDNLSKGPAQIFLNKNKNEFTKNLFIKKPLWVGGALMEMCKGPPRTAR
jgi:hypothetical protein